MDHYGLELSEERHNGEGSLQLCGQLWLYQNEVILKGRTAVMNGVVDNMEGFASCWFSRW